MVISEKSVLLNKYRVVQYYNGDIDSDRTYLSEMSESQIQHQYRDVECEIELICQILMPVSELAKKQSRKLNLRGQRGAHDTLSYWYLNVYANPFAPSTIGINGKERLRELHILKAKRLGIL